MERLNLNRYGTSRDRRVCMLASSPLWTSREDAQPLRLCCLPLTADEASVSSWLRFAMFMLT